LSALSNTNVKFEEKSQSMPSLFNRGNTGLSLQSPSHQLTASPVNAGGTPLLSKTSSPVMNAFGQAPNMTPTSLFSNPAGSSFFPGSNIAGGTPPSGFTVG
jgi:hypothetical protein